jgi:anti-sigma B factor antagonist
VTPEKGSFAGVRTGELATAKTDEGLCVLTITGEHDLSTAPALRRRLGSLLAEGDGIIVDLSSATFIDSSILGAILDGRRRATDAGTGFAVVHANGADAVGRVLDVTGLRAELPVHADREDAVSALSVNSRNPS